MIETKLFEVRDRGTFIPVMATLVRPDNVGHAHENYLLRRAGYGEDACVLLCRLECSGVDRNATYDPYAWGSQARTMTVAHLFILDHWHELFSGDVVDVEFILGETGHPKRSEKFDET